MDTWARNEVYPPLKLRTVQMMHTVHIGCIQLMWSTQRTARVAHLHVEGEEGEVRQKAVATRRRHQESSQGHGALRVDRRQHSRRAVHHLVHVAANPVEW